MKYYYLYLITCLINNKIYIGVHETCDLNDNYMGSGAELTKDKKLYGIENFKKQILGFFRNRDSLYAGEAIIVDMDFVRREDTYNILPGGQGGFLHVNKSLTPERRSELRLKGEPKRLETWMKKFNDDPIFAARQRESAREAFKIARKKNKENNPYGAFFQHKHTNESKVKIGAVTSVAQKGSGNSQFGTCWIYNIEERRNLKIKKYAAEAYFKSGWIKGRKMSFK